MPDSNKNPEEKQSKAVWLSRGDGSAILGNVDFIPMIGRHSRWDWVSKPGGFVSTAF